MTGSMPLASRSGSHTAAWRSLRLFPGFRARREACERIVEVFRINSCLLDRKEYDTLFDNPPCALMNMTVAYESERFRLLFLEWDFGVPSRAFE